MILVAVCFKGALGPQISFYEAPSEEAMGRYVAEQQAREDYITHSLYPLSVAV